MAPETQIANKAMTSLLKLQSAFETLCAGHTAIQALEAFSALLSNDSCLRWIAGDLFANQRHALSKLTHAPGDKHLQESSGALSVRVRIGERTRLTYEFATPIQASCCFIHLVMKPVFSGNPNLAVALRWFHGSENEEVICRFRPGEIVVGQSLPQSFDDQLPLHLSIGRISGKELVLVNAKPIMYREAKTAFPTGVTLDFIGTSADAVGAEVLLLQVDTRSPPGFFIESELCDWFKTSVEDWIIKKNISSLALGLHAFSGLDCNLPSEIVNRALDLLLHRARGYQDFIASDLLSRSEASSRPALIESHLAVFPKPTVAVSHVGVKARNPWRSGIIMSKDRARQPSEISILDEISFNAYAGDIVGILGKNGSGKSTLLRAMVGAMPISSGFIGIDGDPILLRPGAGMQGELTGRQNILKAGIYMGLVPEEVTEICDEVIDFSELRDHIDRPFKHYSDGMKARLVFSLATAIPRDILFLDELLSAGDMGFQRKASARLESFIERAKVVMVVQHTFDFVLAKCNKVLLLSNGKMQFFGDPRIGVEIYKESL